MSLHFQNDWTQLVEGKLKQKSFFSDFAEQLKYNDCILNTKVLFANLKFIVTEWTISTLIVENNTRHISGQINC